MKAVLSKSLAQWLLYVICCDGLFVLELEKVVDLQFLASTDDCAWAFDEEQRIVFWNAAAESLFGYTAEEVYGRFCYDIIVGLSPEHRPYCEKHCKIIKQVQEQKAIAPINLTITDKNGRNQVINTSTLTLPPVGDSSKIIVHLSRILTDTPFDNQGLSVRLFGNIVVQKPDGSMVQGALWRRIKTQALFVYLLMTRGQPVTRDILMDTLWPDKPRQSALHNLNTAVYNLRYSLEPGLKRGADSQYIHYEGSHYWLEENFPVWLDCDAFKSGIRRARQTMLPELKATLYNEALSLYQGEFLADLNAVLDWHLHEQRRLHELYLSGLKELATLFEKSQEDVAAKEVYTKLHNLNPYAETAVRGLMRLALKRDDRATAVLLFQQLADVLHHEMDIAPSPETRQLYQLALK